MGLSNGSSQTLGLLDVVSSWEAFETINTCVVTMRLEPTRHNGRWAVRMVGVVWDQNPDVPVARLLVSESLICSPMEWRSLDTVAFRLLYALDGLLASREFDGTIKHKA